MRGFHDVRTRLDMFAGLEIEDFNRLLFLCRDEEPVTL
jgi:hypothetical protein